VNKYIISLLLLLISSAAFCQKKSKVLLVSSSRSEGVKVNGVDLIKVYNGQWKQDFSTMRSDSAYFHQDQNSFDAFGHVVIHQGDTLNIYADKLHYDGNTKVADLNDNVVMIDKDARLTTNHFTYSTATRIGTYTDGGKIVDKTNTLTSLNGYYFAGSHDAYFRYNVVCVTTDARIVTDTMRYNSQSKINYFYGPTHIYGQKDKDTLDTDYGTYNTNTEEAFFTKNNMYRQGTKSLKGDTLYYDRVKGFGRATKHVVFNDNEQKMTIFGGLGTYTKTNDLTIVTRDPYIIMVTEEKDTTKTDTLKRNAAQKTADSLSKIAAAKNPKNKAGKPVVQNMKPSLNNMPALPIQQKMIDSASRHLTMPVIDSFSHKLPKINQDSIIKKATVLSQKVDKATQNQVKDAAKGLIAYGKPDKEKLLAKVMAGTPATKKDTSHIKRDSVYMSADTIETRILTFKELTTMQTLERLSHIKDTTKRAPSIVYKKQPKYIELAKPVWPRDTSYYHTMYFGPPKRVVKKTKPTPKPVVEKNVKIDSTFLTRTITLPDTAHVRILMAFHSAKIFKSDLQAVADSIFYSNSDSTIRCYTKPMVWTEGSQLSGDTINLIMRNKKLDKMDMFPNAFIVNIEKTDSVHFNQVGGKKLRGFFLNDKLHRVYIDGNAETIYFARDSATNQVTDMQRSFSSRIWVMLENNETTRVGFITKADNRVVPMPKVKDDDKVLKNFIWKPKNRPVSKESVLPSYNKKLAAAAAKKPPIAGEPRSKKLDGKGLPAKPGAVKSPSDSLKASPSGAADTSKTKSLQKPALKTKADSVKMKAGQDSLKAKLPAAKPAKQDTVKKP
jgi:lipopolysaccharide export system protein LptA